MVWVVVPLDEIKIYKAFVLGLGADADPADVAIVQAVIAMARPLRCEVVAEGYYLSRPLPAAALEQWAWTAPWGVGRQDAVTVA